MENRKGLCTGRVASGPGEDQPGLGEQGRTWGAGLGPSSPPFIPSTASYLPYTSPTHSPAQGWVGTGVWPPHYLSDPILLPWTLVFEAPRDNEDSAPHCPLSVPTLSPFPLSPPSANS